MMMVGLRSMEASLMHREDSQPGRGHALMNRAHGK